jgi:prenyltransferase beta subunit
MRKATIVAVIASVIVAGLPAHAAVARHENATSASVSSSSLLPTCFPQSGITRMVAYIRAQQQPDGSFPSIGQSSTADAVYALVASHVNPSNVKNQGKSAIDWIYSQTGNLQDTGVAAKFLLALILAGRSTTAPNGFNFVTRVQNAFNPATGYYDPNPTGNAYALIALRAAGRPIPNAALQAWAALQQGDGGWSAYIPQQNSDTNTTAVAMIALIANGRFAAIPAALGYLRTQQSADGGFTFSTVFGTESDSNSTGLVILSLLASAQNLANWEKSGVDPVERLIQLQNPSGAFRYADSFPGDNAFATFQAGQAAGVTAC